MFKYTIVMIIYAIAIFMLIKLINEHGKMVVFILILNQV
jgi:hypothetical protein